MRPGAGEKVDFPLFYENFGPVAAGQSRAGAAGPGRGRREPEGGTLTEWPPGGPGSVGTIRRLARALAAPPASDTAANWQGPSSLALAAVGVAFTAVDHGPGSGPGGRPGATLRGRGSSKPNLQAGQRAIPPGFFSRGVHTLMADPGQFLAAKRQSR